MLYFFAFIGLFLMLLGWLLYRNPNWINPYGDMTPEMKARVDIDGLKKSACIACNVYGAIILLATLLFGLNFIGENAIGNTMSVLTLAFVVWVIVAMRKYNGFGRDENGEGYYSLYMNKAAKITVVVVAVMMAALVFVVYYVMKNR